MAHIDSSTVRRTAACLSRWFGVVLHDLHSSRINSGWLHRELRNADLPSDQRWAIAHIASRVSVWPSERKRILRQLIRESLDAAAAGQPPPYPIKNRQQLKRLLRRLRTERDERHPYARTARVVADAFCVGIAVFVLLAPFWISTVKPTIRTDYLAMINAPALAVAPDQRAWPHYREIGFSIQPLGDQISDLTWYGARPIDPLWRETIQFVHNHADLFAHIREASQRPGMGIPIYHPQDLPEADAALVWDNPQDLDETIAIDQWIGEPTAFDTYSPYFGVVRHLARALALDMQVAIYQQDGDRFLMNLRAYRGMARQSAELRNIVTALNGASIENCALSLTEDALRSNTPWLNDAQLRDLDAWLDEMDVVAFLDPQVDAWFALDWVQASYTDDGEGSGRPTSRVAREHHAIGESLEELNAIHPVMSQLRNTAETTLYWFVLPPRHIVGTFIDEVMAATQHDLAVPLWQPEMLQTPGLNSSIRLGQSWSDTIVAPISATPHVRVTLLQTHAKRDGLRVVVALQRHYLTHGRWPDALDELVPHTLDHIPPDPATGQPMAYTVRDGQPIVYSYGADLDDDGGQWAMRETWNSDPNAQAPAMEPDNYATKPLGKAPTEYGLIVDGDWILFPSPTEPPAELPDPSNDPLGLGP